MVRKNKKESAEGKKFRQGDVFIEGLSGGDTAGMVEVEEVVLAEGEQTGHFHKVIAVKNDVKLKMVQTQEGITFAVEGGDATVIHQEHAAITLSPGIYKSFIQTEYDPVDYRRRVMD